MIVRTVGMITNPFEANNIIFNQGTDMIAMARAFLSNPRWYGMQPRFLIIISKFLPNMPEEYN